MNINTQQQEASLKSYNLHLEECEFPLKFWDWYARWCEEEGLFNDRSSDQFDKE